MPKTTVYHPDLTTPLCDTPLIPEQDFHKKLKAILSVPKEELQAHMAANPDPPQKRGPKPKSHTSNG